MTRAATASPYGGRPQTPPDEPQATNLDSADERPPAQATQKKLADAQISLGHLVVRDFPRSFRGYNRAAVRKHLEQMAAWLSLKGLDDLVRERFNEQDPLGRQLRVHAESDAEQIREHARREADRRLDEVRRLLEAAHQAEIHAEQVREEARRDADSRAKEARDEAGRRLEAAQHDAERIRAQARRDAEALLAKARADATAERRHPLARLLTRGGPGR